VSQRAALVATPGGETAGTVGAVVAEVIQEIAAGKARCEHLVQVYREPIELAQSVATFFAAGFEVGEPAVAVLTAANRPLILERLEARGWRPAELEAEGVLHLRDAEETLAAIDAGPGTGARSFNRVVGELLDRAAATDANRRIRVFGEMVDVLVRRGDRAAADTLEGYWNDLFAKRHFTLLCGYKVDLFDVATYIELLPQVYRSHTHVLQTADDRRFEEAVDRALTDVLGAEDVQKVYARVARSGDKAPRSHLALQWICAHMPRAASDVFAAAQAFFAEADAAAA